MPYIKLLSQDSRKLKTSSSDLLIISDIVDSGSSFESPILVRDTDTLNIYFGTSFSQYEYYKELIENSITLLLYRPISCNIRTDTDDYVDYSKRKTEKGEDGNDILYGDPDEFPVEGDNNVIYTLSSGDQYIWNDSGYINIELLPQNIVSSYNYESFLNRDTLRVLSLPEFTYTYPEYPFNNDYKNYTIGISEALGSLERTSEENIENEYQTFAFVLDFTGVNGFVGSDSAYYLVLGDSKVATTLIWYSRNDEDVIPVSDSSTPIEIKTELKSRSELIMDTIGALSSVGWAYQVIDDEGKFLIYRSSVADNSQFFELPGLTIEPDRRMTNIILSKATEDYGTIDFWSRTIGKNDDSENIGIKIEKIGYYDTKYRITISRYTYSEVYEGNISSTPDRDGNISSIESIINRESKLVQCKIAKKENLELPTGFWYMRGAVKEEYKPESYWKSLQLLQTDSLASPDFFVIPDVSKYIRSGISDNYNYYTEYQELLSMAKNMCCQVLIQNSDTGRKIVEVTEIPEDPDSNIIYKLGSSYYLKIGSELLDVSGSRKYCNPYQNDFLFNYPDDPDNYLVYFFRSMFVNRAERPGYYLFIKGIFSNNFKIETSIIRYDSPEEDSYSDTNEEVVDQLEKHKSNYLSDNNLVYYYRKYFNHPGTEIYNTSILCRFCITKVSRSLTSNRWALLGKNNNIREIVERIFERLKDRYDIIKTLSLESLNYSDDRTKVTINIKLEVSELVTKDVNLSVTLNYT